MCKAAPYLTGLKLLRRRTLFCMLNNLREVLSLSIRSRDMSASGICSSSRCVQPVLIRIRRRDNAVGGHKNRSVEALEFLLLFPPCISVISNKIRILLKSRIGIGGEHLTVRVDINTCSLCLFKEHLKISEVMPRHQYSRIISHSYINPCHLRISVGISVSSVKKAHNLDSVFSCLKRKCHKLIHGYRIVKRSCKCSLKKRIYLGRFFHKCIGML